MEACIMKHCITLIGNEIKDFHPGYFAMVMATGIVSIAFEWMAFPNIARALFVLNLVLYLILCVILAARAWLFRPNLMADLRTLQRAWLFLTFVVGTNTLGTQLVIFQQARGLAILLWFIALISWIICLYFILSGFILLRKKPLHEIVNGATLLIIVSTVSVALQGFRLLDATALYAGHAYFGVWMLWASGFALYLFLAPLLIYRLFFRPFQPEDWKAPYWICMGAVAIITWAGSEFVIHMPAIALWEGIRETTLWMTIFAWTIGTCWIPYQLIMDIRKFIAVDIVGSTPLWIKALPWSRLAFGRQHHFYHPSSWSRVFPMGMYTACTLALSKATDFGFLSIISRYWGWFALLIWSLTFIGMLRSVIALRSRCVETIPRI
jgi:tellurite resistance protein TehA-like permease